MSILDLSDSSTDYSSSTISRGGVIWNGTYNHHIINLDDQIENGWGHETEEVMLINKLFESVKFYKTGKIVEAQHAEYMIYETVLSSTLMGGKQLIRVTVPISSAIPDYGSLNELPWKSLTSLVGTPYLKLRETLWKTPHNTSSILTRLPFVVTSRDEIYTTYKSPGGLELKIKLDPKIKGTYQYPNNVTVLYAIEKFKTTLVR